MVNDHEIEKRTYGSLVLGKRVPSSLILSLILNRRRLSTENHNNNMNYNYDIAVASENIFTYFHIECRRAKAGIQMVSSMDSSRVD